MTDRIIIKKTQLTECESIISDSLNTFFLPIEMDSFYSKTNCRSLCGRYLVKKSILDFFKSSNFLEIEILNNEKGKPEIVLLGELKQKAYEKGIVNILCSISHSKNWVAGMIVINIL